jgi:hypothetical protein
MKNRNAFKVRLAKLPLKDKQFLCIHFIYDPVTMIRNIEKNDLKSE